jgi:hypothetical protein
LERLLRIFFLQQWFTLSDPAVEEAMYDSSSMREFVGIEKQRDGMWRGIEDQLDIPSDCIPIKALLEAITALAQFAQKSS